MQYKINKLWVVRLLFFIGGSGFAKTGRREEAGKFADLYGFRIQASPDDVTDELLIQESLVGTVGA